MIVIAVANGAFREAWAASSRQAVAVGAVWLGLTLAFEFLLGRFVSGLSWRAMLAAAPYLFFQLQR
jgi:hypothetical protein